MVMAILSQMTTARTHTHTHPDKTKARSNRKQVICMRCAYNLMVMMQVLLCWLREKVINKRPPHRWTNDIAMHRMHCQFQSIPDTNDTLFEQVKI